jgi:hypothetical protein
VDNKLPEKWRTVCEVSASPMSIHYKLTSIPPQTDQVLFPEPSKDPEHDLNTEHREPHKPSGRISASAIALACAMGLALVSLVVSYVRGIKLKTAPEAVYFTHETSEKTDEEQGGCVGTICTEKKQDGHASVSA